MEIEKGKTYKYLREKREVTGAKENLKRFSQARKLILDALKENDLTVDQLALKIGMRKEEVVYWLMSLVKFGYVQTGGLDDMDEYFSYKLKK
jgi:hypothetical protein